MGEAGSDQHHGGMNENESSLPPLAPERPRLRRRMDDKMIGGVASGLARHFAVDVSLVRLAFVGLAIFGGSGLLLYLIAWLVVPADDWYTPAPTPPPASDRPGPPRGDDPPMTVQPMV